MQSELLEQVKTYLMALQDTICQGLENADGKAKFVEDNWQRAEGGGGRTRVIQGGNVIEQGGVNYSHVFGASMPASATAHRVRQWNVEQQSKSQSCAAEHCAAASNIHWGGSG